MFGIRTKLLAFTGLIILLVAGSLTVITIFTEREQALKVYEEEAFSIANTLSRAVFNDLYDLDMRSLRIQLASIRVNPDIGFTYILDEKGLVLSDGSKENPLRDQRLEDPFTAHVMTAGDWITENSEDSLKIGGPISLEGMQPLGRLYINFTLDKLNRRLNDHLRESLAVSAICVFLGLVLATIFAARFTRPIREPTFIADRISSGGEELDIPPAAGGGEIGTLSRSMRLMLRRLNASNLELRELTLSLDRKVKERTRDLKDSESHIRAVVDNAVDGIITIGENGVIESFNPAAEVLFGYRRDEVVGKNVNILMPQPYHAEHDGYLRAYLETGERKIIGIGREVEGRRKDGYIFPMDLAVSEMHIAGNRRFVGICRDITDRKQVDRMKNEFISTVSHELRTPLTSIQGSLALITKTMPEELSKKHQNLLGIADRNCRRLVRLINDILDIEKIESGKMVFNLKAVELMPLVQQAIEANQSYAQKFSAMLVLKESLAGIKVYADEDRIAQVLTNLMSNAAKFSPPGGTVEVKIGRAGHNVRVEVADHGPGIAEEFQDRIFGKFAQADSSSTRRREGTGLGLSIAKAIVDKHGGGIGFTTEPGAGTTFYFELPEWHRLRQGQRAADGKRRILVCEDEPDVAALLKIMLEQNGATCDVAYTAAMAKEMLAANDYSAMTLDLMLPDIDGLTFMNELRADEKTRDLPIVVISARAESGRLEINGDAAGVVDWLAKPIDRNRLLAAVDRTAFGGERPRILHVEDDADVLELIASLLAERAVIESAKTLAEAREMLKSGTYDLMLLDIGLPDGNGLDLLPGLGGGEDLPVVLFTGQEVAGEIARKVDAVMIKSHTSMDQLLETMTHIIDRKAAVGRRTEMD